MNRAGQSAAEEQLDLLKSIWPDYQIYTEDYLHPTREFVLSLFDKFLTTININVDKLVRQTLSKLTYPETSKDSTYTMVIYQGIYKILHQTDFPLLDKFKLGSILAPEPESIQFIIKYIVNYLLFRRQCLRMVNPMIEEVKCKNSKLDEALRHQEKLHREENNYFSRHLEIQEYLKDYADKRQVLEHNINLIRLAKEEQEKEIEELHKKHETFNIEKNEESEKYERLGAIKNDFERYEHMLASKDKLNKEEGDLNSIIEDKKEILTVKQLQLGEFKNKIESKIFQEPLSHLLELYKLTEELESEIRNEKQQTNNLIGEIHAKDILDKNLETTILNINEETKAIEKHWHEEKIKLDSKQAKIEKEQLEHTLERLEKLHKELDADMVTVCDEINQIEMQDKVLQQEWMINYREVLNATRLLQTNFKAALDCIYKKK